MDKDLELEIKQAKTLDELKDATLKVVEYFQNQMSPD